jgi:uncharacterized protein
MNHTPFVFGKIADKENFTNRKKDIDYLTNNFKGLVNTIIISPRRWGKTSLVRKATEIIVNDKDYLICHIDVFNCRTQEQFLNTFANAILKASYNVWDEFVAGTKKYLSHMLPKISINDGGQGYELTLGIDFKEKENTLDEILDLPQKLAVEKNKSFIVCIDEFQNINEYDDSLGFQRKLRAHWQLHNDVCYCLYGSKRHMLLDIFNEYSMPFYKFGDIIFLDKICRSDWELFITKRFDETNKTISTALAGEIADRMKNHPYYVQQLCQQVWLRTTETVSPEILNESFDALVNQLSLLFTNLLDSFSSKQISFLIAIAKGEENFSSKEVLTNYQLGTSANIKNLKNVALKKDIIDILPGNKIVFQDPVFEYWILNHYLSKN